jgi:hypothetical protein
MGLADTSSAPRLWPLPTDIPGVSLMAGNNRTTVWNMDTARGFVQWLGGALAVLAIAW